MTHLVGHKRTPRASSKELQASLGSVKVRIHDWTIKKEKKKRDKNGILGSVTGWKPLLTKKKTKAPLTFAKNILIIIIIIIIIPQDF